MIDPTENIRKAMVNDINSNPKTREELETQYGTVWNTQELQTDYQVESFLAPFVGVTRKSDGKKGMLMFQHNPRFYYNFE